MNRGVAVRSIVSVAALAIGIALGAPVASAQQKVLKFIPQADLRILDPITTTAYITRNHGYMTLLERTDHATYCPYKGDASYFSIPSGGDRSANAVWTYEAAYAAVTLIKDHLAFYPDRVDAIEERPGA